jgi:predicted SAM-dependent methyltransferase
MKKSIRRSVETIVPWRLARNVVREVKTSAFHWHSRLRRKRTFGGRTGLRVNVGCGPYPLAGWVNIDILAAPGLFFWDCRRSLPFDDNSVALVFTEHFFEHLEHPAETSIFLSECMRCLRPGGLIRIVVPDAGMYLRLYNDDGWDRLLATRPLKQCGEGYRDIRLGITYATKMEMINSVFRQWGQHEYAYDAETLILHLERAGFSGCVRQRFGVSGSHENFPDRAEHRNESLYVEATRPGSRSEPGADLCMEPKLGSETSKFSR